MTFVRRFALVAVLVGLFLPYSLSAQTYRRPQRGPAATPANFPDCVKVSGEVRFRGFGYNHVVKVKNECTIPVRCDVATSVDPTPTTPVSLSPGQQTEVQTRTGSPASTFEPRVQCRPAPR